jgi:hypothetical protein
MLARISRAIYWVGMVVGCLFLMLNVVPISVMLGILEGAENGKPWVGMMILTFLGVVIWGVSWAIRYFTTGASGISPKDRGWYSDVA